ncbi:hypothetical protein TRVA0_002S05270 [Trichomonascus vanleenenianus]|uniref:Sec20p n=1 Tax=Trichomonascus vanleenenianus TaxID=2268995 RepID=UPI003ECB8B77
MPVTTEIRARAHVVTLDRLQENLKLARMRFRRAQIQAKKNGEQNWKSQREQLFAGKEHAAARNDQRNAEMSTEERIIGKSEDITATLRRVHQMAQTEVTKSSLNIEDLETSTRALMDLEKRYTAFDVLLHGSNKLVKHLEQADRWDRIYMIASLSFLALTLAWVVWRRILRMPVMLLLWAFARMIGLANFIGSSSSKLLSTASSVTELAETAASSVTELIETVASSATELAETAASSPTELVETIATAVESALHDL